MRSCHRFPGGIPHLRVGSHVLLTRPPLPLLPKQKRTFDLHVLGTPPAFILSQDQTRHSVYLCHPLSGMASVLLVRDPSRVHRHDGSPCAPVSVGNAIDRNCDGLALKQHRSQLLLLLSTLQLLRSSGATPGCSLLCCRLVTTVTIMPQVFFPVKGFCVGFLYFYKICFFRFSCGTASRDPTPGFCDVAHSLQLCDPAHCLQRCAATILTI